MPVLIAKVTQKDVPIQIEVIGNVEAYSTITVKAQVGGQLTKVFFKEGDYIKSGDPLFLIDPRPLQAQLNQADANRARAEAQLAQAEAQLGRDTAQAKYLKSTSDRMQQLVKEGVISKDQGEMSQSNYEATSQTLNADRAAIASVNADIAAARAASENLRLQLSFTDIRSPIDGRTGNMMVKQGNVVTANTADLVTINEVQPVYVTFGVPEAQLSPVKKFMALGKLQVIAIPQDEESARQTGVLTFIDNNVDSSTGTIKMKATFKNPDRRLWPGEFVRVMLRLTTQQDALVVPNQAVQTGQDGPFIYVVKQDNTVESRPVITGTRVDQELVIDKGVQLGETIVTEGQLRLAPGSKVVVRDGRPGGGRNRAPKS